MRKRRPWFRKAPPLAIEFLEDRVTPAAIFDLWAGTLTVSGTDHADWIRVTFQAPRYSITMNDVARSFAAVEVLQLRIHAHAGDDTISVAANVKLSAHIMGGPGNDFIQGGAGDDVIEGDLGDDTIFGGAGNDQIAGDAGPDQPNAPPLLGLQASGAVATAFDSSSQAQAAAPDVASEDRAGNDQISGGAGNDTIRGGGGDDIIVGGTGNDLLFGGAGDDSIQGNDGNDRIDGGPGADRVDGGSGNDLIQRDSADRAYPQVTVYEQPQAPAASPSVLLASNVDYLFNVRPARFAAEASANQNEGGAATTVAPSQGPASTEPIEEMSQSLGQPGGDAIVELQYSAGGSDAGSEATTTARQDVLTQDSDSPIAQQVHLLLQGAVLTEATSDGPDGADFTTSKRGGRRRPTYLYIKPLPLPDLVPDIELPMPKA
jgi:hypothetical protein